MAKRFATIQPDELDHLTSRKLYSTNTSSSTTYAANMFHEFLSNQNLLTMDFVMLNTQEQDQLVASFFTSLRRKDGDLLKRMSFNTIKYALSRYLNENYQIKILDSSFSSTNTALYNMSIIMKQSNKGFINHYEQIPDRELHKIFNEIDVKNPQQLQWYVFIIIQLHFCKRGCENIEKYTKSTFAITEDNDGTKYIYQSTDEMTKNNRQDTTEKVTNGRVYEQPTWNEKCPVKCFQFYCSKLSNINRLWQRAKPNCPFTETQWYTAQPIGVNTIARFMKNISAHFQLSKSYTNHCLRVSSISILGRSFEENDIKTVSGHSTTSSLGIYKRVGEPIKRKMADTLSNSLNTVTTETSNHQLSYNSSHFRNLPGPSTAPTNFTTHHPESQTIYKNLKFHNPLPVSSSRNDKIVSYSSTDFSDMPVLSPQQDILTAQELKSKNSKPLNQCLPALYGCSNFTINFNINK